MKRLFIIAALVLMVCGSAYALTVGKLTGFDYGVVVGGKTLLAGDGGLTPSGGTYWDTAMTARWNTPMTALWNTTMDTEIP